MKAKKIFYPAFRLPLVLMVCVMGTGCSKSKPNPGPDDSPIQKVRDDLKKGDYEQCLTDSKDVTSQAPPGPFTEEAYYLHAYAMAFGRSDFQGAKLSLKQLLALYPSGRYAMDAQKLLADCQYWLGHYQTAGKEYKKLGSAYAGKGLDSYALFQGGNCLLLDDKVEDALAAYRELTDKYPTDPLADSAQLMVADSYIKLQNTKQAKAELQKLISFTRDKDIQDAAQKTLRQIEEKESLRKDAGVP